MSGWNPDLDMHYGRGAVERDFYWWCPQCKANGRDSRLSFAFLAGQRHKVLTHG